MTKDGSTSEHEAVSQAMEGLATASWSNEGFGFLLIGGRDQGVIDETAKHF